MHLQSLVWYEQKYNMHKNIINREAIALYLDMVLFFTCI